MQEHTNSFILTADVSIKSYGYLTKIHQVISHEPGYLVFTIFPDDFTYQIVPRNPQIYHILE